MNSSNQIPFETAKQLCKKVYLKNKQKIFSIAKWQCWGFMTFTKGDESKMCFANNPLNRGCNLVNNLFAAINN